MKIASGIVAAIVKVPHGLLYSALTTTSPSPASAMTMTNMIAMAAMMPANGLISRRAISASDLPPRRTDAQRMTKSWTAPARTTPAMSHRYPGA